MFTEHPRPARVRDWPHAGWLAVATVCFGAFMGQLDASIVTLTYKPVEKAFGVGPAAVEWISLAYLLVLVALLVPVGRLSDVYGRKLLYLYGFVVFTAGSAACGLAPDLPVLIGARVVQACGAALLQANSVALVVTSAPAGRTRSALGVQAAAQAVGLALGPTIGGVFVATIGWRWVYMANVPVGVLGVLAGIFLLPRTRPLLSERRRTPLSASLGAAALAGAGLLALSATGLLLACSAASGLQMPLSWVIALVAVAAAGVAGFVLVQRRSERPLVDPKVLGRGRVQLGVLGALAAYLALFGPLVLVPARLGSNVRTGLILTALPVGFAVAATTSGQWLPGWITDGRRARLGALLAAAALAVGIGVPLHTPALIPLLVVTGLGLGIFMPANNTVVMSAAPPDLSASTGGLVNMSRSLGTALGVSVITLCLSSGTGSGARLGMLVLAAVALIAALCSPGERA